MGVLDTFLIMLESWKLAHKSRITYHGDPWQQWWPYPPSTWSGTINVLQVWTSRTGCSWHTSNHSRKLKICTQVKNHILWWSMTSMMTQSSKFIVRTINVLQVWTLRTGSSILDTSNPVIDCTLQNSSMIWSVSRSPCSWCLYLDDRAILDVMDNCYMWFLTCMPNFSSLISLEVCQEPPVLEVHTWRMLRVPD